jgi:hypothetical protein
MAARASRARGHFQWCGEREGAKRKMAFTVNGRGATFHGDADPGPDGSCIVPTWVVLVYIPLIPLGSMRVLPVSQAHLPWYKRSGQRYRSIKVPLHVPHPWTGWGVTLGIVVFFAILGRH